MLRAMAGIVVFALLSAGAQAATEVDRRECAAHQDSEAKIAACTRIADDKSSAPGLLTLAYRNRGIAYGNKGLHELANFDFRGSQAFPRGSAFALWPRQILSPHRTV